MGFGKDYTADEEAQLVAIEKIFDKLYPADLQENGSGVSVATFRSFFVPSTSGPQGPGAQWFALTREINGEAVVRLGQNFRNTNRVVNRMLKWRTAFQTAERLNGAESLGGDAGRVLGQAWMRGIIELYRMRLESCFAQLNIQQAEEDCISPAVAARTAQAMDGEQLVSRCISGARAIISRQMSASPYFVRAIGICRELVQVLQIIQGLLNIFSSYYQTMAGKIGAPFQSRRTNAVELNFPDDHLVGLRTPQWLFRFIFLFLGAMDLLQDPSRDATALSGQQLDTAIHSIACLVGEVDGKRRESDVKTTLDALVLGHVKNSCSAAFPPQETLRLLAEVRTGGSSVNEEADSAAQFLQRCGPLLTQLLVRYPEFMASITNFSRRNGIEDWGVSVMLAELFCWDVSTPPTTPASAAGYQVIYHVPVISGTTAFAEDAFDKTAVFNISREALRPLLSGLLSASATVTLGDAGDASAAAPASGGAGGATSAAVAAAEQAGSAAPLLLSAQEQKLCAMLLGVVSWLDTIDFPDAARMTRWSAMDVGSQVMREFNLGRWCLNRVLREVLREMLGVALEQIGKKAAADAEAAGQEDVTVVLAPALLRYLLRVERVWNALTEHRIELDSGSFDPLRAMGVTALPTAAATADFSVTDGTAATAAAAAATRASYETGTLADYKYEFYDAVQDCMKAKWPRTYADLLTGPLLQSLHVYLVHAESATQRGVGGRAGNTGAGPGNAAAAAAGGAAGGARAGGPGPAGPRMAGMKRPPPPPSSSARDGEGGPVRPPPEPELVALATEKDLHGALRLVRCIKNRDSFVQHYTVAVRERLLTRPAPDVITDADLEKNKKRCEQEAEQFLAAWLSDTALLKTVRELHTNYTPQTATFSAASGGAVVTGSGRDFKLSTTVLDWRLWGDTEAVVAAATADSATASPSTLPNTAAELTVMVTQASAASATSATAPLPFPRDALPYLAEVEQQYNRDHSARTLRWDWHNHVFTSFTLLYPKENGRVTTVHGTLLLQRLFLAIAAYGRAGVELGTLAHRAGLNEKRVFAVLRPCLDRDRLLVRAGDAGAAGPGATPMAVSPAMRLALNYDYVRPPNRPRGEYTYWQNIERRRFAAGSAEQDTTVNKRRDIIKSSIMQVMKQVQRIQHDELYATVREKNAKRFEVTVRNFKQEIEELIDKSWLARDEKTQNEYVFRA